MAQPRPGDSGHAPEKEGEETRQISRQTTLTWTLLASLGLLAGLGVGTAGAAVITWTNTSGNWSTAGNWSPASVPNATTATIAQYTADLTTTLDMSATINRLSAASTNASWTIAQAGGNTLTFGGSNAQIVVSNPGSGTGKLVTINPDIVLGSDLAVYNTSLKAGIRLNGNLSGGYNLTISSNQNNNQGMGNIFSGTINNGGTISIADAGQLAGSIGTNTTAAVQFTGVIGSNVTGFTMLASGNVSGGVLLGGSVNNAYTGLTEVRRGTLYLGKTGGATAVNGNLTVSNTANGVNGSSAATVSAPATNLPNVLIVVADDMGWSDISRSISAG